MTRKGRVLAINGVLLLALAGAGWGAYVLLWPSSPSNSTSGVRSIGAQRTSVVETVSAAGTLQSGYTASADFGTSGTVTEVDVKVGDTVGAGAQLAKLDATVDALRLAQAQRIVIIGPVPEWSPDLYLIVARQYLRVGEVVPNRLRVGYLGEPEQIDRRMADHFAGSEVDYVSVRDGLCTREAGCLIRVGSDLTRDLIAWDYGHFTETGSMFVASHIIVPHLAVNRSLNAAVRNESVPQEAHRDRAGS